MNTLSFKYIYNLFVQAAEDVPSWAPEWVKKHPHFEQYESLEDIVKSFPIKYYREPLIIEKRIIDNFEESIDEQRKDAIWDVVNGLYKIIGSYLERVENATPQIHLLSSKILPLKLSLQENSRKIKDLEIKIDKCSEIIDFVDKNKNNWNEKNFNCSSSFL